MQAVIFDLGGVLFDKSRVRALLQINQSLLLRYMWAGNNPRKLQIRYFEILEKIHPSRKLEPNSSYQGVLVPQLINDHMRGDISSAEAVRIVRDGIGKLTLTDVERSLILAINELTFSPKAIAAILKPLDGLKLLQDFVKLRRVYPHLKIILLSNFEAECFEAVRRKHAHVFDQFDGLEISGNLHMLKPDPAIFQYVLDKYNLEPERCLYIDDAPENVEAACRLGIRGVRWTTLRQVSGALRAMGLPAAIALPPGFQPRARAPAAPVPPPLPPAPVLKPTPLPSPDELPPLSPLALDPTAPVHSLAETDGTSQPEATPTLGAGLDSAAGGPATSAGAAGGTAVSAPAPPSTAGTEPIRPQPGGAEAAAEIQLDQPAGPVSALPALEPQHAGTDAGAGPTKATPPAADRADRTQNRSAAVMPSDGAVDPGRDEAALLAPKRPPAQQGEEDDPEEGTESSESGEEHEPGQPAPDQRDDVQEDEPGARADALGLRFRRHGRRLVARVHRHRHRHQRTSPVPQSGA